MTLEKAIDRLKTRVEVDLEAEIDLENNEALADEITRAAKQFWRDSYYSYEVALPFTLVADQPAYDTLVSASKPVFHAWDLYINGTWIFYYPWPEFRRLNSTYATESSNSKVAMWTHTGPTEIRLSPPPNSTAVNASGNIMAGFVEHPTLHFGNDREVELSGAEVTHLTIVNKAAVNMTPSHVASAEGIVRRNSFIKEYQEATEKMRNENLERVKPLTRRSNPAKRGRIFTYGYFG